MASLKNYLPSFECSVAGSKGSLWLVTHLNKLSLPFQANVCHAEVHLTNAVLLCDIPVSEVLQVTCLEISSCFALAVIAVTSWSCSFTELSWSPHFDERVEGWITSSYCVDCGTTVSVQLVQRITWNSSVLIYLHINASFLLIEILTCTLSVSQSIWGLKSVIYWQIACLFAFPPFIVGDKHIGSAHYSCILRLACTEI